MSAPEPLCYVRVEMRVPGPLSAFRLAARAVSDHWIVGKVCDSHGQVRSGAADYHLDRPCAASITMLRTDENGRLVDDRPL